MDLKRTTITSTNTGTTVGADILEKSDKRLKVVLDNTTSTVTLTRKIAAGDYVGYMAGMEFTSTGD